MISADAIISRITTLADGTYRIIVDFNELSPDEVKELAKLRPVPVKVVIDTLESFQLLERMKLESQ